MSVELEGDNSITNTLILTSRADVGTKFCCLTQSIGQHLNKVASILYLLK